MPITSLTITSVNFDSVLDVFSFTYSVTTTGRTTDAGFSLQLTYGSPAQSITIGPVVVPNNPPNNVNLPWSFTPANIGQANFDALAAIPVGTPFSLAITNITSSQFTGSAVLTGWNNGVVVCFAEGTRIATPQGERAVEALKAGDLVLLADGSSAPVRWLGVQKIALRFADETRARPIRIRTGALGGGLPLRDLCVSPAHALLLDGALVQAGALVNGTTILPDADAPDVVTYYHVELDRHALLLAEGAPAESFLDSVEELSFANLGDRAGFAPIEALDLPRARSHRQVPPAVRARIAAAAAELDHGAVIAAA